MTARARPDPEAVALWLALLAALSVGIWDLCAHWLQDPWSRYSVSFIPLLAWCVYCDAPRKNWRWLGLLLLCGSMTLYLGVLAGGFIGLARPTISVAMVGLLLIRDACTLRTSLLALWIIPIPYTIANRLHGDALAALLFRGCSLVLSPLGFDLDVDHLSRTISIDGQTLTLIAVHDGLPLAVHLAGLGWYMALRRHGSLRGIFVSAFISALFALPIQFGASVLASLALAAGTPDLATILLETAPWVVTLIGAIYWSEIRHGPWPPLQWRLHGRSAPMDTNPGHGREGAPDKASLIS